MFDAILTATNSSFQKGMTFCRSTYVKKVMSLTVFMLKIFMDYKRFAFF